MIVGDAVFRNWLSRSVSHDCIGQSSINISPRSVSAQVQPRRSVDDFYLDPLLPQKFQRDSAGFLMSGPIRPADTAPRNKQTRTSASGYLFFASTVNPPPLRCPLAFLLPLGRCVHKIVELLECDKYAKHSPLASARTREISFPCAFFSPQPLFPETDARRPLREAANAIIRSVLLLRPDSRLLTLKL
jgi:hypothetical protein